MACLYNCCYLWCLCSRRWSQLEADPVTKAALPTVWRRQGSHPERLPCFCYLPRITAKLHQKTRMCHLSSDQRAEPRIYHKDNTKEAQRDQSGSTGPSCKYQIDDLTWHRPKTESFQTSQKAHRVLGNRCVLNTYTDPWTRSKPCTPIISTTTYSCNLIVGISVGTLVRFPRIFCLVSRVFLKKNKIWGDAKWNLYFWLLMKYQEIWPPWAYPLAWQQLASPGKQLSFYTGQQCASSLWTPPHPIFVLYLRLQLLRVHAKPFI